ncbi:MAG: cellulase family glycosylhydrolase [Oscillospiraceae bacterium]|nr:cellulase family glycosylhydrolase [Oscillospiraceae bacterium]
MKKHMLHRLGGAVTAAGMLLAALSAVPSASAADLTGKDISTCNYVYDAGGAKLSQGKPYEMKLETIGVSATENVTEVWLSFNADTSSGLPTMPAFGYTAPGYNEDNWYQDGIWLEHPTAQMTVVFPIPDGYPLSNDFQFQLWGDEGESLSEVTVNAVGIKTGDGSSIGTVTRRGDVNDDKTVTVADPVALAKFLLGAGELAAPANGDLDGNNRLNAVDLTILKRGLMNGTLGGSTDTGETAMEFVSHMKLGWNLGNTLDATVNSYTTPGAAETSWGCPFTTKAMIDCVKNAGFNTIRIPVTWGEKCSGSDFKIDDAWMNRVQEIVDYAISDDMYVILNIHHDNTQRGNNAYFYPDQSHYDNSVKFITSVWTQVANRFESYDNHLVFETLNEPRLVGTSNEWNGGTSEARKIVNEYNAAALKAIRATGGNNTKRFVMMPGYAASSSAVAINDIVLPDDDHLIVDIHGYAPYDFALNRTGTDSWNQSSGSYEIVSIFEAAKSKFLSKGIPVVIGEFGALNKSNEGTRATWAKYYVETADSYGIPCVWWDNNQFFDSRYQDGEAFGLIDRGSLSIKFPQIMSAMVEASKNRG